MKKHTEDLSALSSKQYSPNRKFCRHRRRLLRSMTGGMLDDIADAMNKISKRRVKKFLRG